MGQKVNPIAVRLNFNRLSDSNWFSDYYYSTLFYHDVNLRQYFSLIKQPSSNKLGFRAGRCVIHHFPKRSFIHLFCLSEQRSEAPLGGGSRFHFRFAPLGHEVGAVSAFASRPKSHFVAVEPKSFSTDRPSGRSGLEKHEVGAGNFQFRTIQSLRALALVGLKRREARSPGCNDSFQASEVFANESLDTIHYKRNFFFWSSQASTLQKKRALIQLFRGVANSLTKFYFGEVAEQEYTAIVQRTNGTAGGKRRSFAHFQFGSLTSLRSRFAPEKKELFMEPPTQSVRFLKAQARHEVGRENSYFNSYAMHYFFLKKSQVFSLNHFAPATQLVKLAQKITLRATSKERLEEARSEKGGNTVRIHSEVDGAKRKRLPLCAKSFSTEATKWSLDFSLSNIHHVLSLATSTSVLLRPIKVNSIFYSASLVAQDVACKLEQKKSFRLICRLIFQQLNSFRHIKGIRITCSGRINGAEIAKTECRKFGETSLHVFSDKIDFARAEASTSYGLLGVKVWISFI